MDNCPKLLNASVAIAHAVLMNFAELPQNWPELPLTDPQLASGVLDLVIPESARACGAIGVLLLDTHDRLLQPVVIDLTDDGPGADREALFAPYAMVLRTNEPSGALLVGVARAEGLSLTADDTAWQLAAQQACGSAPRLLGVHLLTCHGSREMPAPRKAA